MEPAQQAATGTWSSRKDVPPPAGFKPIFDYPVVNDYRSFLVNERELVALRKRFEGYTGPVVNAGGVRWMRYRRSARGSGRPAEWHVRSVRMLPRVQVTYCAMPPPNDQFSFATSTRLITTSSGRTFNCACMSSTMRL